MKNFWLYFGIFFVCSGIGTVFGLVILMYFFWDMKSTLNASEQSVLKNSKYFDEKTAEKMK